MGMSPRWRVFDCPDCGARRRHTPGNREGQWVCSQGHWWTEPANSLSMLNRLLKDAFEERIVDVIYTSSPLMDAFK